MNGQDTRAKRAKTPPNVKKARHIKGKRAKTKGAETRHGPGKNPGKGAETIWSMFGLIRPLFFMFRQDDPYSFFENTTPC